MERTENLNEFISIASDFARVLQIGRNGLRFTESPTFRRFEKENTRCVGHRDSKRIEDELFYLSRP